MVDSYLRALPQTLKIAKIQDKIIVKRLWWFVLTNKLIHNNQFGFKKGKSVLDSTICRPCRRWHPTRFIHFFHPFLNFLKFWWLPPNYRTQQKKKPHWRPLFPLPGNRSLVFRLWSLPINWKMPRPTHVP